MNPILLQAMYYGGVMVLTIFLLGVLMKGFFWAFVRVKLSFGRLVLVKVRSVNRDHYKVGTIEDEFLIYKTKTGEKRLVITDPGMIYRSIGVMWIDVHEAANAIMDETMEGVSGFDAVRYNNLYVRALTRPNITDQKDRLLIGGLLLLVVCIAIVGFLVYKQGLQINAIAGVLQAQGKGVLVAGG